MNPDVCKGTKLIMIAVGESLIDHPTLVGFKKKASSSLQKIPWMDSKSRANVIAVAEDIFRKGLYIKDKDSIPDYCAMRVDDVMKAFNQAKRSEWAKTRNLHVKSRMKVSRAMKDPIIFYLVSSHQKPQKAHESLQGNLLVDRYWRQTLESKRIPQKKIYEVKSFIEKEGVQTVQWAMGEPCYLIVRPNCRHKLIPIRTDDVMEINLKELNERFNSGKTGVKRPITDHQRWVEYKSLREDVRATLEKKCQSKRLKGV